MNKAKIVRGVEVTECRSCRGTGETRMRSQEVQKIVCRQCSGNGFMPPSNAQIHDRSGRRVLVIDWDFTKREGDIGYDDIGI
jgi:DnaJ-class molecular chaperone